MDHIFAHNEHQNGINRRDAGGTWLLAMGYPEGSPTHSLYPVGHSCFVAAAATITKAFFKDSELPNPMMVDSAKPAGAGSSTVSPVHV